MRETLSEGLELLKEGLSYTTNAWNRVSECWSNLVCYWWGSWRGRCTNDGNVNLTRSGHSGLKSHKMKIRINFNVFFFGMRFVRFVIVTVRM